jgi:citrate lyase subunit beta/citryl-CoA lyase
LETYRREAEWSAALGFDGKRAIHPAQVPIALEVYTPPEEAVSKTSKIIEKYEEAEKKGIGAILMGGEVIDAGTYKIAEKILARKG